MVMAGRLEEIEDETTAGHPEGENLFSIRRIYYKVKYMILPLICEIIRGIFYF